MPETFVCRSATVKTLRILIQFIISIYIMHNFQQKVSPFLGEPLRAKYYGGLEKTSISHDRKYCAVIG